MAGGWLSAEETSGFLGIVGRNPVIGEVLERAERLALPGWVFTGGCVFQTAWNVLSDRPPASGILDYDLFYFDDADLSWEAEDAVLTAGAEVFGEGGGPVEIRNEARVHLWFAERFGVEVAPLRSAEEAIDRFVATACCVGITTRDGNPKVYAPFGLDNLYGFRLRPNRMIDVPDVYRQKSERWVGQWPQLRVEPWVRTTRNEH